MAQHLTTALLLLLGNLLLPIPCNAAAATPPDEIHNQGRLSPLTVGDRQLRLLTPTCLELRLVTTKAHEPTRIVHWDFVDVKGELHTPPPNDLVVTVDGQRVPVTAVSFRRRPIFAAMAQRDLRLENTLTLRLAQPIDDGQVITVTNPSGNLWPMTETYRLTVDPRRSSPMIHVNQEGYAPNLPKQAMVGYYLGSGGELDLSKSRGFLVMDLTTGATVFTGQLQPRRDQGYEYAPLPYQHVLQADFTTLTTPGEYQLVVPGLGSSPPFLINDGIPLAWLRTYALGLYHQRCGGTNALPFTRFTHAACHVAPAAVPTASPAFTYTWATIAGKNADYAKDPRHTAPQLKDAVSQLYPFINQGKVDVSGGHHDAGDYSKYTINSAALVHLLMFTVDAFPAVGALDNLGLPESGDGIGDLLQEVKWEADYLAKLQDADGGFYFIVYPRQREYEQDVSLQAGDTGDPQVVWPKNTSATAAAVAALAQCASSPIFRHHFPAAADAYLAQAKRGWQFLETALAKYGHDGAYQKITFYGDEWQHDDELAWAACELYLATGEAHYQERLLAWFPQPGDSTTFHWGWWRLSQSWGNAIRSYAFAARTGRLSVDRLDPFYLRHCEEQVLLAGDDARRWSEQSAYGTSFPTETKRFRTAGWYFSLDRASDLAVAWLLKSDPGYRQAVVANLNYEGGTNPVNRTYVTGLGLRRQREVVSQFALNDQRVFAPTGIPIGNVGNGYDYLPLYGMDLKNLTFPSHEADPPYPFYDRWSDVWSVSNEFTTLNQGRSMLALAMLITPTQTTAAPWTSGEARIIGPTTPTVVGTPITLQVETQNLDLTDARIVWEARDQEPAFGASYSLTPQTVGDYWVEVEATWPDGRRVFARSSFMTVTAEPLSATSPDPSQPLAQKIKTGVGPSQ